MRKIGLFTLSKLQELKSKANSSVDELSEMVRSQYNDEHFCRKLMRIICNKP